jgi:hypothetical protein
MPMASASLPHCTTSLREISGSRLKMPRQRVRHGYAIAGVCVFPQWSGGARISIVHKSGTLETL